MRTQYANPMIHKAFNVLKEMSADEEMRMKAEVRERALKDEASLLYAAKKRGKEIGVAEGKKIGVVEGKKIGVVEGKKIGVVEGKKNGVVEGKKIGVAEGKIIGVEEGKKMNALDTAKKLLSLNTMPIEQIAEATGLSLDEVREL